MRFILNLLRLNVWFFREPDMKFVRKDRHERLHSALRRMRIAVGLMVFAILLGTFGYRMVENTSWFDSYYMSLVTLSTVGFGEVIPLSHMGRIFTSFLILFNIGFFTYAVSTVTSIFADGDLNAFFHDYNMMQKIQQLQHHTIVCGFGRHAIEVCQELEKQRTPLVVIESDPEKTERMRRETSYLFLTGDATEDGVLQAAGIERAATLVVTLPVDANNLFIVLSARQINPGLKIISRLNNAADEKKLLRAGANHVVMPERIGGFYMATLVNKPDLVEFFTLISNMGTQNVVFEEIAVAQLKEQYRGRSIAGCGLQDATKIPIVGIRFPDGHYELNPAPEVVLQTDMHIVVLGDPGQVKHFSSVALSGEAIVPPAVSVISE